MMKGEVDPIYPTLRAWPNCLETRSFARRTLRPCLQCASLALRQVPYGGPRSGPRPSAHPPHARQGDGGDGCVSRQTTLTTNPLARVNLYCRQTTLGMPLPQSHAATRHSPRPLTTLIRLIHNSQWFLYSTGPHGPNPTTTTSFAVRSIAASVKGTMVNVGTSRS